MKSTATWLLTLLLSGTLLAQTGTAAKDQPPAAQAQPAVITAEQVKALQDALAAQQKQIDQQQQQLEALRQQLEQQNTPHVADASLHTSSSTATARAVIGDAAAPDEPKESPLSFRIGGMDFTPGGFADFTNVFRSTNLGSNMATSFGALPYSNTIQGHLTEMRMSGQNSRLSLKATGRFGANDVTGYVEADFNGNDAANVFVTANSHTNRLRLYWVDVRRGRWEFLGGQSWSWLTPNRKGLSPLPADVFYTLNTDQNFQVGLPWVRSGQFRFVFHPNQNWAMGLAVENPDQFVGAGEVIFPFAFNAALGPQFDANNQTTVPNVHPDLIPKIAYDTDINGKHFHVEAVGLVSTVKITMVPIGGIAFEGKSATAIGGGFGLNLELAKGFRVLANGFWSNGGGRYLIGLGPQAVVNPIQTSPTTWFVEPSLVHSGAGLAGFEAQVTKNNLIAGYYGGFYFQRNAFRDTTSPLLVKPFIGFGGINSPNSANRAIQEGTFDWTYTMWKNPQYGALQFMAQASYVTRAPWFVALGAPKNAHLFMTFTSIRYILP